jgi:hypothetical protein
VICETPSKAYPDGRTGTKAGYLVHWKAREAPCEPCRAAHAKYCADYYVSETPERRAQRHAGNRTAAARYRQSDPERNAAIRLEQRRRSREWIRQLKEKPCADCGIPYPFYVMQFDHVRGEKLFNIGSQGPTRSVQQVLDEVEKCDVVCANCHAARTYSRLIEKADGTVFVLDEEDAELVAEEMMLAAEEQGMAS